MIDIEDIYELTPMQKGILFHTKENSSDMYFEQSMIKISGDLNSDILEAAFNNVIGRYDSLRCVFSCEYGKEPLQIVFKERKSKIFYLDISEKGKVNSLEYINKFMEDDRKKGFDIYKDILIRMSVFKYDENEFAIVLSFHHIIMDGWSWSIVLSEIINEYNNIINNINHKSIHINKFSEFIKYIKKCDEKETLDFWKKYLNGYEAKAVFLNSNKNTTSKEYLRKEKKVIINTELTNKIIQFTKQYKITMSSFFHSLWGILISKYNDCDDILIGSVVSGRNCKVENIEKIVGMCMNTVPMRIKYCNDTSIMELLKEVHNNSSLISDNSFIGLSEVLKENNINKEEMESLIAFENYPLNIETKQNNINIKSIEAFEKTNFDINLLILPNDEINLMFVYNEDKYGEELINNIANQFYNLINKTIIDCNIKVKDMDIIDVNQKTLIIDEFNNTQSNYNQETIAKIFNEVAIKYQDKVALKYNDINMTYRQLNEETNLIAYSLLNKGIKSKDIVAVTGKKNLDIIMTIIAIIKIGAVYLPLDPFFPKNVVKKITNECNCKFLIDLDKKFNKVNLNNLQLINIDKDEYKNLIFNQNIQLCDGVNTNLAYIMYTSGTTGIPKGVMIEHKSIIRLVNNTNYIDFSKITGILQTSNIAFDASTFEIWGSLLNGKTLHIVDKENLMDIEFLKNTIDQNNINTLFLTTSFFNQIVQAKPEMFKSISNVLVGGEKINQFYTNKLIDSNPNINIINGYGPTENTTFTTYFTIDKKYFNSIPIGKPISNSRVYILDNNKKLQPIMAIGEIYIGGEGLARGYINNEELTKERFINNPYIEGEKIYKTGDLGRWLFDGNLEYLGRVDHQVKIRGYRIELDEIKTQLLNINQIKDAIVIVREDTNNNKYLCAYIVGEISQKEIRDRLLEHLPEYMVPTRYVYLKDIPLTMNGKIDVNKLPEPELNILNSIEFEEPRNEIEKKLVDIWEEVLGVKGIGINDNFFENGGDSIKSIQVISKLNRYDLDVEVKDIFQYPNIKQLSNKVKYKFKKVYDEEVTGDVKLTPIQKWLFKNNNIDECNHFNQGILLGNKNRFNEKVIEDTFKEIIKYHDILRVKYTLNEAREIVQEINNKDNILLDFFIVEIKENNDLKTIIYEESKRAQEGMDIINGELVKVRLFRTVEKDYLLIIIHHLVIDGVSWRIILEDFNSIYNQILNGKEIEISSKTDSFKLWANKIYEYANSFDNEKIEYWSHINKIQTNKIPKDNIIDRRIQKNSRVVEFELSKEETIEGLKSINSIYNTNIEEVLVIALQSTLEKWMINSNNVLLNLEGHGRERIIEDIDINKTVGWFTTMYPILLEGYKDKDLDYKIKSIKEVIRKIPNKGIDYGINKYINLNNFNISPEISLNYLGDFDSDLPEGLEWEEFNIGEFYGENIYKEFAIDINAKITNKKLKISIGYDNREYKEETIYNFISIYKKSIKELIEYCESKTNKEITPSDLGVDDISIDELTEIFDYIEN